MDGVWWDQVRDWLGTNENLFACLLFGIRTTQSKDERSPVCLSVCPSVSEWVNFVWQMHPLLNSAYRQNLARPEISAYEWVGEGFNWSGVGPSLYQVVRTSTPQATVGGKISFQFRQYSPISSFNTWSLTSLDEVQASEWIPKTEQIPRKFCC